MVPKLFFCVTLSFQFLLIQMQDTCNLHKTCSDCIKDHIMCKWCSMDNFKGIRCISDKDAFKGSNESSCNDAYIQNPQSDINSTENWDFSADAGKVIQLKPQQYEIKLRAGSTVNIKFSYKGAKNYPADLYFLFDASKTMITILKAAADASDMIVTQMKSKTDNVYLGIGSFIDKNALPYVTEVNSSATYSFRNQLKLTNNLNQFKDIVSNISAGVNFDSPEGGLDALAQVLTCKNEIGWRDESRKIVIFFTDDTFHSAGDGKWAGIVQPYDGKCYTKNGIYMKELEMDYPSISILNNLAAEMGVTIIFAIRRISLDSYNYLEKYIKGSKYIHFSVKGTNVDFDSGHLEKTLTGIYEEISQTIKLKVNMMSIDRKNVKISFHPECTGQDNVDCKVKIDQEIGFQANVTLLSYYEKDNIKMDIGIEGINEKLNLNIKVIKDCECETNKDKIQLNSEYCNKGGTKKCGICECNSDRYGDKCGCRVNENNKENADSSCKAEGIGETCSGRGTCSCGTCICQPDFEGPYCECNKESCPGVPKCSGHGKCSCGKCLCFEGWTGNACDCSLAPCKTKSGKVCNNRGKCVCGKCECHSVVEEWDARHSQNEDCEMLACSDCHHKQCVLLKACALCHHRNDTACVCDPAIRIDSVVKTLAHVNASNRFICEDVKDGLCYTRFAYQYEDHRNGILLFVQTDASCIKSYYQIAGGILVTLILGGILTVVAWKLLTDARDRGEFESFIKQQGADMLRPRDNDIYEPPTTTFRNPVFRKDSVEFRL